MKEEDMATILDDLVNIKGVILAFEFTPDGTCTSYKNVTREMAAMICHFCVAVTMNFNALASGFTDLSMQQWVPQKGWVYVRHSYCDLGKGATGECLLNRVGKYWMKCLQDWQIEILQ
jgi:roadblock/LC7 domain-containing protein